MLLLFDIDGTLLIKAAAEHKAALHEAIEEVHRVDVPPGHIETAGKTDGQIAREILMLAGVPVRRVDDGMDALRDAAVAAYARRVPADLSDKVAPGAAEALADLEAAGHRLSLVTGNLEPIARLKLSRAGLQHFFAPSQGGFGSDSEDRTMLPAIARHRAGGAQEPWPRAETIVIGDTPLDITCARADNVRVIAVTTGPFGGPDLAGADMVLHSAEELPRAVATLAAG